MFSRTTSFSDSTALDARPRIALALGGGAAWGWAHIGVIRTLIERGAIIEAVAGTSIGAVVAAAFASGKLDVLEELARSTNALTMLRLLDVRFRGGILGGRAIRRELDRHFENLKMEDLALPCATVAADLTNGAEVIIQEGPVTEAVHASLAIPGIFRPVHRGNQILADGGLVNPVPVSVARSLGPWPIVAVNLFGHYQRTASARGLPPETEAVRLSAFQVAQASLNLVITTLTDQRMQTHPAEVVITPAVGHTNISDFRQASETITAGRDATNLAWSQIINHCVMDTPDRMPVF